MAMWKSLTLSVIRRAAWRQERRQIMEERAHPTDPVRQQRVGGILLFIILFLIFLGIAAVL